MKKINELTERFAMWFFRIKRKKTIINNEPTCMWDKNSYKPW